MASSGHPGKGKAYRADQCRTFGITKTHSHVYVRIPGFIDAIASCNEQLLQLKVNLLIPAALEGVLTKKNVRRIRAKAIVEMANGPTTPEADASLAKRGIPLVPDILSNAGGVTGSYFEWIQGRTREKWSEVEVFARLEKIMRPAFNEVWSLAQEKKITLREAAFVIALRRVASASEQRSTAPEMFENVEE